MIGWDVAWSRISTAIITGEGVDVFQVGTTWNPQLAATGGLSQLDINEFGGADAFMAANLASTTYKGDFYGVPWFAETRALYYNKDMFAAAGVEPPQTYEELVAVGQKLIATHRAAGRAIAIAGTNAYNLIHTTGPSSSGPSAANWWTSTPGGPSSTGRRVWPPWSTTSIWSGKASPPGQRLSMTRTRRTLPSSTATWPWPSWVRGTLPTSRSRIRP